jgi:deoxyribose-phosphate aldolase
MTRDELQKLIDTIVSELMPALSARPQGRCACHAVLDDCCPDRLRGVLDAGASRVGTYAGGGAPVGVAAMIDHTLLKPDATRGEIEALCREAAQFKFATVCVNPTWVATAARLLAGSGVGVCSVVGFPLGATPAGVKNYETRRAIFDGATEIDMVINIRALKSGDLRTVERDIDAVVEPCRQLRDEQGDHRSGAPDRRGKITACTLSKAAGADFVKTSTGFASGGATLPMSRSCRVVGAVGVKAAGGVHDLEGSDGRGWRDAWRPRGRQIVQESKGQKPAAAAATGY